MLVVCVDVFGVVPLTLHSFGFLYFDSIESQINLFATMPQGKMKVKSKLPTNVRKASVHRGASNINKSKVTKNKKSKGKTFGQKLQNEVTKEIAKNIETNARGLAEKFSDTTKLDKKKKK